MKYVCHQLCFNGISYWYTALNSIYHLWLPSLHMITANGYTCLEKLTTEKCKQQAKQPEKKILKIKILWKFSLQYLS